MTRLPSGFVNRKGLTRQRDVMTTQHAEQDLRRANYALDDAINAKWDIIASVQSAHRDLMAGDSRRAQIILECVLRKYVPGVYGSHCEDPCNGH